MGPVTSRSARWVLFSALVLMILSTPGVSAQQKRQTLFSGPYQQLQMAYANGYVEGIKYVVNQVLIAKMKPEQLQDLVDNKGGVLKALVVAQAKKYAEDLGKLNKETQSKASKK